MEADEIGGVASQEWVTARPASALRSFVDGYVGYRTSGFDPGLHRGLPSRHMTLIVSIGGAIEVVVQTDPAQPPASYRCVVGGLQDSAALIVDPGAQEGVAVELSPLGCRVLFGMPARALWDMSLELSDVAGPIGRELWERLQSVAGWPARFAVCDDVLGRMAVHDPGPAELAGSWRRLVASQGRMSVEALAGETGYSRQHLTRRFRDEFGLSPKRAARVIRFERAKAMLTSVPRPATIAEVAAACGYADHAHLVRDVVELAGCTPRELATDPVPFVQDDPAVRT